MVGGVPGRELRPDAGLRKASPRGGYPVGQQEIHEHEALRGGFERHLYCRLISFSRSVQIFLRNYLDTIDCVQFESGGQKPKGHIISRKLKKHPLLSKPTEFKLQRMFHENGGFAFLMDGFEPLV